MSKSKPIAHDNPYYPKNRT